MLTDVIKFIISLVVQLDDIRIYIVMIIIVIKLLVSVIVIIFLNLSNG